MTLQSLARACRAYDGVGVNVRAGGDRRRRVSGDSRSALEARVAFEIDDYDPSAGVGWSVMIQGIAHDATDSFDDISWAARAASPHPLAPGSKVYRVAIEPTKITGRRFRSFPPR